MINEQLGLDPFNIPAIIQEKKKYATFTVKEIGGPLEIIAWRKEQAEKEAMNQTIRMQLLDNQKERMFGADAPLGDSVTWQGSASAIPARTSWEEKILHAKSERKRLAQTGRIELFEPVPLVEIIPTLGQRFKNFIKSIWNSAQEK